MHIQYCRRFRLLDGATAHPINCLESLRSNTENAVCYTCRAHNSNRIARCVANGMARAMTRGHTNTQNRPKWSYYFIFFFQNYVRKIAQLN